MVEFDFLVKQVTNEEEKALIAHSILHELPNWFGIEEAIKDYVEKCRKLPFWAAFHGEIPVGFIAVLKHNAYTAEICVMGVLMDYHRNGIGKRLFHEAYEWCRRNGIEFLQVKTLDDSSKDESYAKTREFYKSVGFKPFECIPTLWDEWNPCLIMVMSI